MREREDDDGKDERKSRLFCFSSFYIFMPFTRKKDNWKSKCFLMELANNSLSDADSVCLHFISMKCTRFDDI